MTESLTLKTGDSWQIDGELLDADGAALPLTGLKVLGEATPPPSRRMILSDGRLTFITTVATAADGDWFRPRLPASESRDVVPGVYRADVQLSDGTVVDSSETLLIRVVGDVTGSEVPPRTHGRVPRSGPSRPRLVKMLGGASVRIGRRL